MKVSELLVEERNKDWKYTEKRVKGALNKVILELEGSDSGAMSRLMTRYKRLDRQWKLMEERRNEVNRQVKDVADRIFDAEDALATRVIETVSYSVMLTKATPASEKEATKKVDYESAFSELARLVPELEAKAKEILEKYTELVPPKDTPSALKYTPKLEEGIADTVKGWVAKAKAFVKEVFSWGKSYDAKLDAFRRKYGLKLHGLYEEMNVISGFKPHEEVPTGYNGGKHWTGGSYVVKHDGKQWIFTGKVGTHNKSKKRSFEFSRKDSEGEHRMWVDVDGNVTEKD